MNAVAAVVSRPSPFGLPVLEEAVPVSPEALGLVRTGIRNLWPRIVAEDPRANDRPLLLSYDVHPTPDGPVLIEINTNAGGLLTAIEAARYTNNCCTDWEQSRLNDRLINLFKHDLLGPCPSSTGNVAIVDDHLQAQALLPEMHAIAGLIRPHCESVHVVDVSELRFRNGQLWRGQLPIQRIYWRSTDFLLSDPAHSEIRTAVENNAVILAPSPGSYRAIADKRQFLKWSDQAFLARDDSSGQEFRIAHTMPLSGRRGEAWYADRAGWVFKPASGYASRGVYVGKSISRQKLASLPADQYLAQKYAPHPVIDRDGREWKYDIRFFADRGEVIAACARVFLGQVVGMKEPGSGFAPIRVGDTCCLVGALSRLTTASGPRPR